MKLKYNNNRFFNVEFDKLRKIFNIFDLCEDNKEDINFDEFFISSNYDTLNIYKVIYFFYYLDFDDENEKIDINYKEVFNIVDYLCSNEKILIWIYKKYGDYISKLSNNSRLYTFYMKYLIDKCDKYDINIVIFCINNLNEKTRLYIKKYNKYIIKQHNIKNNVNDKIIKLYYEKLINLERKIMKSYNKDIYNNNLIEYKELEETLKNYLLNL